MHFLKTSQKVPNTIHWADVLQLTVKTCLINTVLPAYLTAFPYRVSLLTKFLLKSEKVKDQGLGVKLPLALPCAVDTFCNLCQNTIIDMS